MKSNKIYWLSIGALVLAGIAIIYISNENKWVVDQENPWLQRAGLLNPNVEKPEETIDELAASLQDVVNLLTWQGIIYDIALLDSPQSGEIIRDFIVRYDDLSGLEEYDKDRVYRAKIFGLRYLGLTRSEDDLEFLLNANKLGGAEKIAKKWIDDVPHNRAFANEAEIHVLIRSDAAIGLALTQKWSCRRMLVRDHKKYRKKMDKIGLPQERTWEERLDETYFGFLIEALGTYDLIDEVGREGYFAYLSLIDGDLRRYIIKEYTQQYSYNYWN